MTTMADSPTEALPAPHPGAITFYAPGLKRHKTTEYQGQNASKFVAVSLTGTACALGCEHCNTGVLRGMTAMPRTVDTLFEVCARAKERGARGVLISGGSDLRGRVRLLPHIGEMIRIREELGLTLRVHTGLPDEATCAGLGRAGLDGAMIDVIGHADTIREVYHLDARPEDYETALAALRRHGVPTVPHIILGLHFGRMLGETRALEMIARHDPKLLVLVVLMPLSGTGMANVQPPPLEEIAPFFRLARQALPGTPIVLGCARPMGPAKLDIDRAAVDAGLDGIAYPAEGTVAYAQSRYEHVNFVDACCGVSW